MIRRIRLGHAPNCSSLGNVLNALVWTQMAVAALWVAAEAWPARRRRGEPGGGETRAVEDPPALVTTGDRVDGPIEAHVQVTKACGLPCPSCHIDPTVDGAHVPVEALDARFAGLAARGVFRVAIGGGEALRHPDLPAIAAAAARHGLTIGLTTAGVGLTERRAADLAGFAQVNVSLDGVGETFAAARGYDGAEGALRAIRVLAGAGARVGVNVVLDRVTFESLEETVLAAVDAGARDIQLLRLKPAGRAVAGYLDRRLTPEQGWALWPRARALVEAHPGVTFRVDCSLVPFLAAHGVDPERMRAFAFLGCHGGDALVSVDPSGNEHPCSFVAGPVTPRWREGVTTGPCGDCTYRELCRGGCHAVAAHLTGDLFAPDPECPMVAASLSAGAPGDGAGASA
ncbi:MAG: radical SAM protein [Pseudomonadota bacterium]|nr:radical SAM protein [Pseudomonadota bacterium]